MVETIGDIDIEIEPKDNKITFLLNKIGITDAKVDERMNK